MMQADGLDYSDLAQQVDWEGVRIGHFIPGRIRLRSAQLRQNEELAERIESILNAVDAIEQVEVSVLTGSVLITYNERRAGALSPLIDRVAGTGILPEGLDIERIKELAETHANGQSESTSFSTEVKVMLQSLNRGVDRSMGGAIDLRGLLPLFFFVMGARSYLFGARESIPWYSHFWFAFSLFAILNPQDTPGGADDGRDAV